MTKSTQGSEFKRLWHQLMGVTESQEPGPGNPKKDNEYHVS